MKNRMLVAVALMLCLGWAAAGSADELSLKAGDTLQKVLEDQKGKRVTVRLSAGEDLTGKVKTISKELVHLGELSGKEYYDAIVELSKISAIIVRVK